MSPGKRAGTDSSIQFQTLWHSSAKTYKVVYDARQVFRNTCRGTEQSRCHTLAGCRLQPAILRLL